MNVSQIISKFGGARPLARLLGYPPTTVQNWEIRQSIPTKHQAIILNAAKKSGVDIKPEHLIPSLKRNGNGNGHT